MRLWHTTLRVNREPIERLGVCTRYSQGKLPAVWLHTLDKQGWAFLHVVRRHGGDVRDVISFEVDVPDDAVKRSAADGLFYILADVPPENILGVVGFRTVSESPLERKAKHAKHRTN